MKENSYSYFIKEDIKIKFRRTSVEPAVSVSIQSRAEAQLCLPPKLLGLPYLRTLQLPAASLWGSNSITITEIHFPMNFKG